MRRLANDGVVDGRMVFVAEGQHDRSQARSAWNHEENSPVPAGRLKRHELSFDDKIYGTDNDFNRPSGTGPLCIDTQALRAWLRSACPSGTKAILSLFGGLRGVKRVGALQSPLAPAHFGTRLHPWVPIWILRNRRITQRNVFGV